MMRLAPELRDVTIAAYSLGYSVVLSETQPDQPWLPWTFRCTWRRSGALGSGEYRECRISPELLERMPPGQIVDHLADLLMHPLVGEEITDRIRTAARELAKQFSRRACPVEFYGGSRDGEAWAVPPGRDGLPADRLILAGPVDPISAYTTDTVVTAPTLPKLLYRRSTLDEERGVWRYQLED